MAFLDVLSAIATPVTSLVGGFMNMIEGDNNRSFNQSQNNNSMNFQREMFDRQNVEYRNRLQLEQNYNDPSNIANRYAGIGINPGSVLAPSQGSATVFGSPSPHVESAPSAPSPPYVNMSASGDLVTSLEKMGSFVSSLAAARKDVAEGTSIAKLLDGQIENQQLSNLLKQQEVIGASIDNLIKGKTGLKKALMDIRLTQAEINLKTFQGFESESKKALIEWQTFSEQAKAKLTTAEYLRLMQLLPLEIKNQEEYNNVLKEEGKKYRAEAGKAVAETKTENDLRRWKVENLRLENEGKSIKNVFEGSSMEDKLKIIKANLSEAQFEARMAKIRKMDMEGYSALHRLLFSEIHNGDDVKKAANLMQKQAFRDALGL